MISNSLLCSPYFNAYYQKDQKQQWRLKTKLVGLANPYKSLFQLFLSLSPYSKIVSFQSSYFKQMKQKLVQMKNESIKDDKKPLISNHKCYKSRSIQDLSSKLVVFQQQFKQKQVEIEQLKLKQKQSQTIQHLKHQQQQFDYFQLFFSSQCQVKQQLQILIKIQKQKKIKPEYCYCVQYIYFVNKIIRKHTQQRQKMKNNQNQAERQKWLIENVTKTLFGLPQQLLKNNQKQIYPYFIKHVKNINKIINKINDSKKNIKSIATFEQFLILKKPNINIQKVNYQEILKDLYEKMHKVKLQKSNCQSMKIQIQANIQKLSILTNQEKIYNIKKVLEIQTLGGALPQKKQKSFYFDQNQPIIIQDMRYQKQYETFKDMSTLQYQILHSTETKKQIKEKLIDDVMKNLINIILEFMQTRHKNRFTIMLKPQDFILYTETAQYQLNILCLIPHCIGLQKYPYTIEQEIVFCTPHEYDYYQLIKSYFDEKLKNQSNQKKLKFSQNFSSKYLLDFTSQHFFMIYFMILLLKFGYQNPFKQIQKIESSNSKDVVANMQTLIQIFQQQLRSINGFKQKMIGENLQNMEAKRRNLLQKFIEILENQFLPSKILIALTQFKYCQNFNEELAINAMAKLLDYKSEQKNLRELTQQLYSHQLRKLSLKKKKLKNIQRQIEILQMLNFMELIASKNSKNQGKNQTKINHVNDQIQIQSYYFYLLMKDINDFLFMCWLFFGQTQKTQQLFKVLNFKDQNPNIQGHLSQLPANSVQKYGYKAFQNKFNFLSSCFTKIQKKTFDIQQTYIKKGNTQKQVQLISKVNEISKNMFIQLIDTKTHQSYYQFKQQQLFQQSLVRMVFKGTCLYFLKSSFQIMNQFQQYNKLKKLKKWSSNEVKKNVLVDLFIVLSTLTNVNDFDFIQRELWLPLVLHQQKKVKSDEQFYTQIKNLMTKRNLIEQCSQKRDQYKTRSQQLKMIQELSRKLL